MNRQARPLRVILAGVAMLSAAVAGPAFAQDDEEEEDASGFYLAFGAVAGFENFDEDSGEDVDTSAGGVTAWGGYQFNEWVGLELQVEYLNGFDQKFSGFKRNGQLVTAGGNVKVFPFASVLPSRFQPFVLGGPGVSWFEFDRPGGGDTQDIGYSTRLGGGVDMYLSERLSLQLSSSYVLTTGSAEDHDYISLIVGFQYQW